MYNFASTQRVTRNPSTGKRGPASSSIVVTLIASLVGLSIILASMTMSVVTRISMPLLIIVAALTLVVAFRSWEQGIKALLVIVIVEGALRKWLLPSFSEWIYFYKDLLMVVILVSYLARARKSLFVKDELKLFSVTLIAFTLYAVAAIGNSRLPHPLVGLLGVKAYLLYVPLVFLVPRMFTTKEKLIAFLRWYLIIAMPVVALSMIQFIDADSASALNRYAWDEQTFAATGIEMGVANFQDSAGANYVRVTGPFSYISGLVTYLPIVFALLLGLISQRSMQDLPKTFRWIYYLILAATVAAAFMTGSRGAVVIIIAITAIFYGFASKKNLFRRLRQAAIGGVLVYVMLVLFFPQAYDALYTRTFGEDENVQEGQGRIDEAFRLPMDEAAYAGLFGYGVGATQNATPVLMSKLSLPYGGEQISIYYEGEAGRVMLELGVVGFLLHLFLRLSIIAMLWRTCLFIRDRESKSLAIAAAAALVFPLLVGGAVTQHTQNVYQWFLIGIPLALLNAEKLAGQVEMAAGQSLQMKPRLRILPRWNSAS